MRFLTIRSLVFLGALIFSGSTLSQTLTVPVKFDHRIIQNILDRQVFSDPEHSAEIFSDDWNCNVLSLKNPSVSGSAEGLLMLKTRLSARGGTPIGGRCIPLFSWQGFLDTSMTPYISADGSRVEFDITESRLSPLDESQASMPGIIWDWVKTYAHPELERATVDLKPLVYATRSLLAVALPGADAQFNSIIDSVAFSHISSNAETLNVSLKLEVPQGTALDTGLSTDSLTEAELADWDAAWQSWDAFMTWMMKEMAAQLAPQNPALEMAFATTLLDARYDLRRALIQNNTAEDPVRDLFVKTWSRLTPILRQELENAVEIEALQYLTFISAVDALVAVDSVAESFAVRFDSATFRSLARLVSPAVSETDLTYTADVDPQLRALLGLEPDFRFADEEPDSLESLWHTPLAFLVPRAYAVQGDAELVNKLTNWVPARADLDNYLAAVNQLLNSILDSEREKSKVPRPYVDVYENLMLATAWQESCWRQYEKRNGQVTPLESPAGSVGMMQVNQHVWRGVYDTEKLVSNVAYNVRAGNEILVHYLVDYAIKKKEHEITGSNDSLARAAYAMYNGGPRHINRYRLEATGKGLKSIDDAFLKKYQAVKTRGVDSVKACYRQ